MHYTVVPFLALALLLPKYVISQSTGVSAQQALSAQRDASMFLGIMARLPAVNELINSSPKPPTLLVPSNDALTNYALAMNTTVDKIPESDMLTLLSYHVIPQNMSSADFKASDSGVTSRTLLTNSRYANLPKGEAQVVYFNTSSAAAEAASAVKVSSGLQASANIVNSDIVYNNGTIHIIDKVLTLPRNCSRTIRHTGGTTLISLLRQANLLHTLDAKVGATCFAPSNKALAQDIAMLRNYTVDQLSASLKYHVATTPFYVTDLKDGMQIMTVHGSNITVNIRDGGYYFNDIRALSLNNIANNGVVYVLDGMLKLPEAVINNANSTSVSGFGNSSATTEVPTAPTETSLASASVWVNWSYLIISTIILALTSNLI